MNPIWCQMKKRNPSSGQNGQLVHWWLLVHSSFLSGGPNSYPFLHWYASCNRRGFGNLMFSLWFTLLDGSFVFLDVGPPFCSFYSHFFGCFSLYMTSRGVSSMCIVYQTLITWLMFLVKLISTYTINQINTEIQTKLKYTKANQTLKPTWYEGPRSNFLGTNLDSFETRGVSHYGLTIYIKHDLKAKRELWKLK
jgi:hypothetical protein